MALEPLKAGQYLYNLLQSLAASKKAWPCRQDVMPERTEAFKSAICGSLLAATPGSTWRKEAATQLAPYVLQTSGGLVVSSAGTPITMYMVYAMTKFTRLSTPNRADVMKEAVAEAFAQRRVAAAAVSVLIRTPQRAGATRPADSKFIVGGVPPENGEELLQNGAALQAAVYVMRSHAGYTYRAIRPELAPLMLDAMKSALPMGERTDTIAGVQVVAHLIGPGPSAGGAAPSAVIQGAFSDGAAVIMVETSTPGVGMMLVTRDVRVAAAVTQTGPKNAVIMEPTAGWVSGTELAEAASKLPLYIGLSLLGVGVVGLGVYAYRSK